LLIDPRRFFAVSHANQKLLHGGIVAPVAAKLRCASGGLKEFFNLAIEVAPVNSIPAETLPTRCHTVPKIVCKYLVAQHSMGDHLRAP
jgi:hypothetical protein